jgi:hypothetical protein
MRQLTTAVLLLALAACATKQAPPPLPSPPAPITHPAPVEKPVKPLTPPPKPAAPGELAPPDLVLTGLSRPDVSNLLGEAQEQRDSNPGRLWVYRSGTCTVEILFLLDIMRNDDFVVDHRVSGTDGTPKAEQACLRRIVKSQKNGK